MRHCTVNRLRIGGGAPVRLMGVINCSPESFYRGSYTPTGRLYDRALAMRKAGADMIDIGARSTAPGTLPITVAEEAERVDAALAEFDGTGITLSVDTRHPEVLDVCLRHDIHAVNDISGLADERYARAIADSGLPVFAMASFKEPGDAVGLAATLSALEAVIARCARYGIDEYVLDPAVGRWVPERTSEDDWELCRNFGAFSAFERPVLAAISRKTFIGDLLEREPEGRLAGTLALTMALVREGAAVVRSHDVRETADLLRVYEKIRIA
ncbi:MULTISPECIES: dihydropteroate synthase [unclassified Methanoculleus]|uniref:dihydropteroate synthase n=1 Tax=unclassified Methanoculleus TaxID=2619537 RepID=UPI0025F85787|nr:MULTISPECIES: dihydropteroate synthase [unclassified Methanoculleus]MCK9317573.1 dihydropteroate synthase [Methanoculleus sp.]MDD2254138.1 dihydropteroate synthase [Methanoculleus sp.]MDD2786955.1 dihydropteroate synthase [Methanoculleus sp.]MDD3215849.1 dihydropteroate synthase [Methanoculleus sp.]MDD4314242.1 dihydropteroate synthase [Methanoculleus sp.]